MMSSFAPEYKMERRDTRNFHGWVIYAYYGLLEEEVYKTTNRDDALCVLDDLRH